MTKKEISQALDKLLDELLSTREGIEVYLQCLLAAIKETCTQKKYKQIADKHFQFLQEAILQEDED